MQRLNKAGAIALVVVLVMSTLGAGIGAAAPDTSPDATTLPIDVPTDNDFAVTEQPDPPSETTDQDINITSPSSDFAWFEDPSQFDSFLPTTDDPTVDDGDQEDETTGDNGETNESDPADNSDSDDSPPTDGDTDQSDDSDSTDETSDNSTDDSEDSPPVDDGDSEDDSSDDSTDNTDESDGTDESDNTNDSDGSDSVDDGDASDGTENTTDESGTPDDSTEPNSETGTLNATLVEHYIHQYVNEERTERGLNSLQFDAELQEIARSHSQDMAERDYFSHTDPEGNNYEDRYAEHGYECRAYTDGGSYYTGGENIAYTYYERNVRTDTGETVYYDTEQELARGIVDQWMNSDGHRQNILADYWENEGIGIAVTDDNRVYATQNFC